MTRVKKLSFQTLNPLKHGAETKILYYKYNPICLFCQGIFVCGRGFQIWVIFYFFAAAAICRF